MAAELYGEAVARIVKDPETAAALTPSHPVRLQAPDHRPGLLRDVQPRQRHAGRPAQGADRRGDADGHRHRAGLSRARRDHLRDRLRRDDRRAHPHRHPRPRRHVAGATSGPTRARTALSRARGRGIPQPVHRAGSGKPVGGNQFRRRTGTARGVDRRLHHATCAPTATAPSRRCRMRSGSGSSTPRRWSRRRCSSTRRCNSWYNGGNVPGKKRMYMGYTGGDPGIPAAMRRDRRRRLHRVQARVHEDLRTRLAHRPGFRRGAAAGACRGGELGRLEAVVADGCPPTRRGDARRTRAVGHDADRAAAEAGTHGRRRARRRPTSCRRWASAGPHAEPEPVAGQVRFDAVGSGG